MSIKGFNINGNIEKYDYESLENKPISLKNGGNVVINEDGTMTAPETEVTDEQVSSAVSDWIEANPDKVTTVQDGTITQEKLSDELIAKLGLEPNHHLTEVKLTLRKSNFNSFWDGVVTGGTGTSTELFETPQYIKIVNNHTCDIKAGGVRFADILDYENATFTSGSHQGGYLRDTIPMGGELIFPTFEWGSKSRKYIQIYFQPSVWNNAWNNIEIYAIYDSWKPSYKIPNDEESKEIFLKDLPMKWIVSADSTGSNCKVYCAVPYYPDFTYHIRGGDYENTLLNSLAVFGIYDDISVFDGASSIIPNTNSYNLSSAYGKTTQYDTSVNGGANANYQWAYFKTPTEEELIGLKWLLIPFSTEKGSDGAFVKGNTITEEYVNYVLENSTLFNGKLQNQYISRWQDKDIPRKHTTQLRKINPNLNDDGTIYQSFNTLNEYSPLANSKWVLFGDSLTDSYGGHDRSSEYFASKIANEFNMNIDNRAKSGSNIYKGGSGNYVSVSGIVMLDAYLAEIEAGTTPQADYITVAFGTNTFKTDMGTNEDTSETYTSSVYGATKYFIEKIREKVPNAVLGFVLSPRQNWGNADAQKLRDVDGARAAIKTVCEEYGVPYIDMSTQSGITVDMLPDGIHIKNDQSQKLYYHAMRRFMMGL